VAALRGVRRRKGLRRRPKARRHGPPPRRPGRTQSATPEWTCTDPCTHTIHQSEKTNPTQLRPRPTARRRLASPCQRENKRPSLEPKWVLARSRARATRATDERHTSDRRATHERQPIFQAELGTETLGKCFPSETKISIFFEKKLTFFFFNTSNKLTVARCNLVVAPLSLVGCRSCVARCRSLSLVVARAVLTRGRYPPPRVPPTLWTCFLDVFLPPCAVRCPDFVILKGSEWECQCGARGSVH